MTLEVYLGPSQKYIKMVFFAKIVNVLQQKKLYSLEQIREEKRYQNESISSSLNSIPLLIKN